MNMSYQVPYSLCLFSYEVIFVMKPTEILSWPLVICFIHLIVFTCIVVRFHQVFEAFMNEIWFYGGPCLINV